MLAIIKFKKFRKPKMTVERDTVPFMQQQKKKLAIYGTEKSRPVFNLTNFIYNITFCKNVYITKNSFLLTLSLNCLKN